VSTPATTSDRVPSTRHHWRGGRRLRDGRYLYWWVEILAIVAFYLIYTAIRNSLKGDDSLAFQHARELINLQVHLGIYHEETLQRWALHWKPFVIAMNYIYGSLHFIMTIGIGIYLFRRWTDDYPRWRNTLAITTLLALVGFWAWPLMPPRWLPHFSEVFHQGHYTFVDTLAKYPTLWSFNSGAMSKLSNQYAAMPSLHCGWSLWCACAMVPRVRTLWAKILFACYPALTITAIVLTANHYFLDAVGGFAVFGIGYVVARIFTRAGRGPGIVDLHDEPPLAPASALLASTAEHVPGNGAEQRRAEDHVDQS
jgi:hypothetical protein